MAKINKSVVTRYYNAHKKMVDQGFKKHLDLVKEYGGVETQSAKEWFTNKVKHHLDDFDYSTTSEAINSTIDSPTFKSEAQLAAEHAEEGFRRALNYEQFVKKYGRGRDAGGKFTGQYWLSMLQAYNGGWQFGGHTFELVRVGNGKDSKELVIYVDGQLISFPDQGYYGL